MSERLRFSLGRGLSRPERKADLARAPQPQEGLRARPGSPDPRPGAGRTWLQRLSEAQEFYSGTCPASGWDGWWGPDGTFCSWALSGDIVLFVR